MKIEQVLAEAPRVLSQEQREFYFENGYLLLESFIQNDELKRLQTSRKLSPKSRAS